MTMKSHYRHWDLPDIKLRVVRKRNTCGSRTFAGYQGGASVARMDSSGAAWSRE
jgi:hypothetical protein